MKRLLALAIVLVSAAVCANAATLTGSVQNDFGVPFSSFVRFIPRSPHISGTGTLIANVPVGVAPGTNGGFSVKLFGGFYDADAGNGSQYVRILIPLNNTNTFTMWDAARMAVNAGLFALDDLVVTYTNEIAGAMLYDPINADLQTVVSSNLFSFWHSKTTGVNWRFYNPDGFTPSATNWAYGIDFSGMSAGALNGADDLALITKRHAITAAHYFGYTNGSPIVFVETNGFFTNYVQSFTNPAADIMVVTLSVDCPADVKPFALLPSSATNYVGTNGLDIIWFRNNSGGAGGEHLNLQKVNGLSATPSGDFQADPAIPFYEGPATGGDSGGPVFTYINGKTVFLFSVQDPGVSGPWVSWPLYWQYVLPSLAGYSPSFVDLSSYQSVTGNPPGVTNMLTSVLPRASALNGNDRVLVVKNNPKATEEIDLSDILLSMIALPGWPPIGVGVGGGTSGIDLRPTTNTFTAPNTFSNTMAVSGSVNLFGSFLQVWGGLFTKNVDVQGDVFAAHSGLLSANGGAYWLASRSIGGHTNMLLGTFGNPGDPTFLYSGNLDDLLFGGTHKAVYFFENKIFFDASQGTNANASNLLLGTIPDARQSANVTLKGNAFNGAGQLVSLDLSTRMPAVDGSQLLSLNASSMGSGNVPFARMPVNQGTVTTVYHGNASGLGAFGSVVESDQSLSDVTTGNASTSAHGYLRKLDGNSAHFLDGNGALSTPPGTPVQESIGITVITGGGISSVALKRPIVFVSPIGLTNNTGVNRDSPWPMPYALTRVGNGIINVIQDQGNYSGYYWDVTNNGVTIQSEGYPLSQWGCNILATNDASTIFIEPGVSNVTVQGLQLGINTNQDGLKAQFTLNCSFRDLWIHDNKGNGILAQDSTGDLIERNYIYNNGLNHTNVNHIHGIYVSGTNLVVRGNVPAGNTNGYGIQNYGNAYPSNNQNCVFYENLIFGNSRGFVSAQEVGFTNYIANNTIASNINTAIQLYGRGTGTAFLSNNIVENNGNGSIANSGSTVIEDYNIVESAVSLPGTHDVVIADPGFVNGAKGLYWLTFSSPARNAGVNKPPQVDFYGYPQTSVSDIGAFQYYPHNWRSYDTRTLYQSSYPDYWSVFAFVPDTLPLANGANVTNINVYLSGPPIFATFKITTDGNSQDSFHLLKDGTFAFQDPANSFLQTLLFNANSLIIGTNLTVKGAETNTTMGLGVVHSSSTGARSSSLVVDADISGTLSKNTTGNAATATTATGAQWTTNLQSHLGGSVVLSNVTSVTSQKFSTNASAQILSLDLSQPDALIIQTNTMQFTNVFNVPAANFAGRISRTIIGSGQAFVCNPVWHGIGTYSTNGGTLTSGLHYQFSLKSDYVVSTNAYYWAIVPANN